MDKINRRTLFSPLILLFAAVIWGFAFAAQKVGSSVPPFTLCASRNLIGALFLLPVIALFDGVKKNGRRLVSKKGLDFTKTELLGGAVCGVFLFLAAAAQQIGIGETDAGKTAFLTTLYVVIVPIYQLFAGKRAPYNVWLGVACAVVGFYFLSIRSDFSVEPYDLVVLLCAFLFGFQILAVGHYSPKGDPVRISCIQFATCFVLDLIFALIFESPIDFGGIFAVIGAILFLGIGSSGIAYTCQTIGQLHTAPAVAAIIMSLESVFGALGGAIFLHEVMSPKEYLGCGIVFLGVLLAEIDPVSLFRKKKTAKKETKEEL